MKFIDARQYMQEFQLGKYVRKLLLRKQLRHLLLFAWRVGHSLRPWLEKERTQSATLDSLEEWKSALTALHLQFCIHPEGEKNQSESERKKKNEKKKIDSGKKNKMKKIRKKTAKKNKRYWVDYS